MFLLICKIISVDKWFDFVLFCLLVLIFFKVEWVFFIVVFDIGNISVEWRIFVIGWGRRLYLF